MHMDSCQPPVSATQSVRSTMTTICLSKINPLSRTERILNNQPQQFYARRRRYGAALLVFALCGCRLEKHIRAILRSNTCLNTFVGMRDRKLAQKSQKRPCWHALMISIPSEFCGKVSWRGPASPLSAEIRIADHVDAQVIRIFVKSNRKIKMQNRLMSNVWRKWTSWNGGKIR